MFRIMTTKIKYLRRVAGRIRRDCVRNERIRDELNITPLKNTLEIRQLQWFGHFCRMEEDWCPRNTVESRTGKRPRGWPRLSYDDYVFTFGQVCRKMLPSMKTLPRGRMVRGTPMFKGTQGKRKKNISKSHLHPF